MGHFGPGSSQLALPARKCVQEGVGAKIWVEKAVEMGTGVGSGILQRSSLAPTADHDSHPLEQYHVFMRGLNPKV